MFKTAEAERSELGLPVTVVGMGEPSSRYCQPCGKECQEIKAAPVSSFILFSATHSHHIH